VLVTVALGDGTQAVALARAAQAGKLTLIRTWGPGRRWAPARVPCSQHRLGERFVVLGLAPARAACGSSLTRWDTAP
jgi:hypothetical protein